MITDYGKSASAGLVLESEVRRRVSRRADTFGASSKSMTKTAHRNGDGTEISNLLPSSGESNELRHNR
jgi:hypothetical protein